MTTGWLDFPGFTIICLIPGHADDNAHKGSGVEAGEGAGRSAATTQWRLSSGQTLYSVKHGKHRRTKEQTRRQCQTGRWMLIWKK